MSSLFSFILAAAITACIVLLASIIVVRYGDQFDRALARYWDLVEMKFGAREDEE